MATTTPNYGLRKPTNNDIVNVATDISGNMDLLDAHAHSGTYERVYVPSGLDSTGATSNSVAVQTAIDEAYAAGGGTVLIPFPGTYRLDTRYMTGYTDVQAAIWMRSNVELRMVPGAKFKLASATGLLANVTLANQRAHIITVIDPYAVAGSHVVKSNIRLTGVELDCNTAGQSVQSIYAGIFLGSVDGAWLTDCKVYDLYGTAAGPTGETMCYDLRSCRGIHYTNCTADGQGASSSPLTNTSTGFSANYSHDISYTGCTAHDFNKGQGFTIWQCASVAYAGCHAYRCPEAAGFNCERSEGVTYSSCISGGRSPSTDGEPDLPTTWFSGNQEDLGNIYGFNCIASYNQFGVYINANTGISPTMISDGVVFSGDFSNNPSGNESVENEAARSWIGPFKIVDAFAADIYHRSNAPHELFTAGNFASGLRQTIRGTTGFTYRLYAELAEVFRITGGAGTNAGGDSDTTDRPGDAEFFYNLRGATVGVSVISGAGKAMVADTDFHHRPADGAMAVANDTTAATYRLCLRTNGTWGPAERDAEILAADLLTSGEQTIPRNELNGGTPTMTSQQLRLSYFTARKTETITQVKLWTAGTAAGATPSLVRVGIWTTDATGALLSLVASTTNDTALLATLNTEYTKALTASFTKKVGQRYAVGVLVVTAAAAPTVVGSTMGGQNSIMSYSPVRGAGAGSQADLPSSLVAGSIAGSINRPYVVLLP
jgi:hypothetical protein